MAQKLTAIYDAIGKDGGISAKMRLAMKTGITGDKAGAEPDSPENMKKFSAAYKEITGKSCPIV